MIAEFISVEILSFRNATRDIDFDVYLRLSESNYAHVFSRTTGLDYQRLAQYIHRGVRELYVRPGDLDAYRRFAQRTAEVIFNDPMTPQDRKIAALLNMTEQNMAEIMTQVSVDPEAAAKTRQIVNHQIDLMARDPQSLALMLKLVSHGDYLYFHSLAVSIFSILIARASGQLSHKTIEQVGLGGFFHDIGFAQLPKDLLITDISQLSGEEREIEQSHARLGMQMLDSADGLPPEVRYIVYQHHEQPGGQGYPNQLKGRAIYYPAKLVSVADAFSELISRRPGHAPLSPKMAVEAMRAQKNAFDAEMIDLVESVFLRGGRQRQAA